MLIYPGEFVFSKMGRDKGRYFIVMKTEDEFVYLCDGDLRKCDKPKRKKIKHVDVCGVNDEFIQQKLMQGSRVTNSELRKAISKINQKV